MKTRITAIEGRSGGLKDGWGYVVGLIGILAGVAAVVTLLLRH
jgi:hypothetical protein